MIWNTTSAIDHCLANASLKLLYPRKVAEETKSVVFGLAPTHHIAIPRQRKEVVSCYVPATSVDGRAFPFDDLGQIHADLVLSVRYPRPGTRGEGIAGSVARNAPSLRPSEEPGLIHVKSLDGFVALVDWLLAGTLGEGTSTKGGSAPTDQGVGQDDLAYVEEDLSSSELENEYREGERRQRLSSYYERDPRARAAAIRAHGTVCQVCSFDFEAQYGARGKGYIEVHHKQMISKIEPGRPVDPVRDMAVLCANCHRMIHRRVNAPLTIEQLREMLYDEG